jgi:dTDP-4-amino-4,6-dideoxygalactose transaminase
MTALTSFLRLDKFHTLLEYIPVVEDCALAIGSWANNHDRPRHAGLLARNGCFSFYPCKHITSGEGGMILTSHRDLADRMKRRRSFGIDPNHGTMEMFGTNARMTEFQAAVGLEQIKMAPEWLERRQENYACLARKLDGMEVIGSPSAAYGLSVILPVHVDRDQLVRTMGQRQVEVSTYYRYSLTQHPVYRNEDPCPVAEDMAKRVVTLSVGPHLAREHMCHQSNVLKELL